MQKLVIRSAFFVEVKMIKRIGIVGMGALGLLYANWVKESNLGVVVDFVMDEKRYQRNQDVIYKINNQTVDFTKVPCTQVKPYDLVIVAVKATALTSALDVMENMVDEHTTIISVLNGITSEKIIGQRFDSNQVLYAIAQGMDAVKFENELTYTNRGHLLLGVNNKEQEARLQELTAFFDQVKLTYYVKEDILHHLWAKFMLNVGINQICMVYDTNYGGAMEPGESHEMMIKAMKEVIELSKYEGIDLGLQDLQFYLDLIATLDPLGLPSMAQDAKSRRYSEVELFSGTVLNLAKKHHLQMPTNEFLYQRIKEIESKY